MAKKRAKTDLCAVIAINKPEGCTSRDVVNRVQRITGERRCGHTGTLDPFATGVLVVCIGPATRLNERISGKDKSYIARISFGARTTTDDLTGEVIDVSPLPSDIEDVQLARRILAEFTGTMMQTPPQYSAKQIDGKRAYDLAREGVEVELKTVEVTVREAMLLQTGIDEPEEAAPTCCCGCSSSSSDSGCSQGSCNDAGCCDADCSDCAPMRNADGAGGTGGADCAPQADGGIDPRLQQLPYWDVVFTVSKGTYIRSLARDIGDKLGCGAFLSKLSRIEVAPVSLQHCVDLDEFEREYSEEYLQQIALDPVALVGSAAYEMTDEVFKRVSNGAAVTLPQTCADTLCMVRDGRMYAIYEKAPAQNSKNSGKYVSKLVIPGGVCGVR